MNYRTRSFAGFVSTCVLLSLSATPALSQPAADYPNRPVRLVAPIGPANPLDTMARLIGTFMQQRFKQPFVVENRPGAGGQIGTEAVVRAPNDGYTLLVSSSGLASEQVLNKEWPFRIDRDLTPVSVFAGGSSVFVVTSKVPVNNLRELVAYSKANPGKLNLAEIGGTISPTAAILRHLTGMGPMEPILYKTFPVPQIIAGEMDVLVSSVGQILPLANDGRVKLLAYMGKERHPKIPQVPTVNEAGVGVTGFDASFWYVLAGPAGMPQDIVNRLGTAMSDLLKTTDFREKADALGLVIFSLDQAQMRERIQTTVKLYQNAVDAGVLKPR